MFARSGATRLSNAIVIDEAHRLASLKLIPRIMQECRKYGIMVLLSSQRVDDFQQGVLDGAGSQLCLKVNHPDAKELSKYLVADEAARRDVQARLMELPRYQALFHTEGYVRPKRVMLRLPAEVTS
jgi:DNA helicase HerA-like ATPase